MNAHLRLSVRRFDGRYCVTASDRGLGHTHRHPFRTRRAAERFKHRVRKALETGRDLDLKHWEYSGP